MTVNGIGDAGIFSSQRDIPPIQLQRHRFFQVQRLQSHYPYIVVDNEDLRTAARANPLSHTKQRKKPKLPPEEG